MTIKRQKEKKCEHCGEMISSKALRCKYCRKDQPQPRTGLFRLILRKLQGW